MSQENAIDFVMEVGKNSELTRKLTQITEGDWEAVVKLGLETGFSFTISEIQAVIPEEFYTEHPEFNPKISWSRNTLG